MIHLSAKPLVVNPFSAKPLVANPFSAKPLVVNPFSAKPLVVNPFSAKPLAATRQVYRGSYLGPICLCSLSFFLKKCKKYTRNLVV